jgi:hypothetical protein
MLGQVSGGNQANTIGANRLFRYEVTGLRQNDQTDLQNHGIRQGSSVFITVPYPRMNDEMRRITRLGGTIVNIQPVTTPESAEEN